jgi:hypothetical protein
MKKRRKINMKKIEDLKKQWEALTPEDKQLLGLTAAFTGGLFIRGIIKHNMKKHEMETIRLVVPKNAELFIFAKGGK